MEGIFRCWLKSTPAKVDENVITDFNGSRIKATLSTYENIILNVFKMVRNGLHPIIK